MVCELFEVFGKASYINAVDCPKELQGTTVRLKSKEGAVLELPAEAACISLRIRRVLMCGGGEADIPTPFKKAILAKVADYLKYHQDVPMSDVVMPLKGETLQDMGVSRWDAEFSNVDKDALFDLALAASLLDITGLFFLASARLAFSIREKDTVKLQREFTYTNDIAADEATMLEEAFANAAKRTAGDFSRTIVMMNGMIIAAKNQDILEAGVSEETGEPAVDVRSWRHAAWRAAILADWRLLADAPVEVSSDRDLVEGAIALSAGVALAHAASELQADGDIVLSAVSYRGESLQYATPELRNDRDFVFRAIQMNASAYSKSSTSLREDRGFFLELAQEGLGAALGGAHTDLLKDRNLIMDATLMDPAAYGQADPVLRQDRGFALEVASRCGAALQYMPDRFKADTEIVQLAVSNDLSAVRFVHASRREDLGITMPWENTDSRDLALRKACYECSYDNPSSQTMLVWPDPGVVRRHYKVQKAVFVGGVGTIFVNIGQGNYLAANSVLDRMPFYQRPEVDFTTIMWGAMGQIGMRTKAFGSQDVLNSNPESLLSIKDARRIVREVMGSMDPPDWFGAHNAADWQQREAILTLTAGYGSGGGWMPSQAADVPATARAGHGPARGDAAAKGGAPLAGWPTLLSAVGSSTQPPRPEDLPTIPVVVGSRVVLVGLDHKRKAGKTGIATKQMPSGMWRVALDDGSGNALLKAELVRGIASPEAAAQGAGLATPIEEPRALETAVAEAKKPQPDKEAEDAERRIAERLAEKKKHEGIAGILHDAVPGWGDYAVGLKVKALGRAGVTTAEALKSALRQDDAGVAGVNNLLTSVGAVAFTDETLQALCRRCEQVPDA